MWVLVLPGVSYVGSSLVRHLLCGSGPVGFSHVGFGSCWVFPVWVLVLLGVSCMGSHPVKCFLCGFYSLLDAP